MNDLLSILARHGYVALALVVGLGAAGLPMPVTVALLTAGAASAAHVLRLEFVIGVAVVAAIAGDTFLYLLGRHMGWALLGGLCRVTLNPESCILRSAESFYRRGKLALVFAKFVPGLAGLAAPLAGSMNMRWRQFARLDLLAAVLYIGVYSTLGFLLGDVISALFAGLRTAAALVKLVIICGLIGYLGYRLYLYWKQRKLGDVPRITVVELAARIAAALPGQFAILDVRSHGYYDAGALRIKGSTRIEPNNLVAALKNLRSDEEFYVYCS